MTAITDFLFGTWPGLILTSILSVLGLCLAALPFLIFNRLNQILEVLQTIAANQQAETLATVNKNVGWLVLNLPKLLKGNPAGTRPRPEKAGRVQP